MKNRYAHRNGPALLLVVLAFIGFAAPAEAAPPLKLATNSLPDGTQYGFYSSPVKAQGGTPPYNWSVTAGALPTGLALNPTTGAQINVEGTPSVVNVYNFTLTVTDSATPTPANDSVNFTVTIAAGACAFTGSNQGAVNFGDVDPSSTGAVYGDTGVTQVQFTCAAGRTFTVTANPAGPTWTLSGPGSLPYTLAYLASGTGTGAAMNLLTTSMGSSIQQADYQNAAGGLYASSPAVSLTISWPNPGAGSIVALVNVSANILKICKVTQAADTLVFSIDPSSPLSSAVLSPSGLDLKIKCTFNAPVTITAASTCNGLAQNGIGDCNGGYKIPYTFNYTAGTTGAGFGAGLDFSVGIGGSAAQAGYADAPVGSGYADIQTVTISY